jgi:hypothetical protein
MSRLIWILGCSTSSRYIEDVFVLTPTDDDEVKESVADLKRTTAAGVDGIKLSTKRYCIDAISQYIVKIINESFSQNKVPRGMKIAKIIPIFKGGSPTDPNNIRLISILPILSKILEKIVRRRLLEFFQSRYEHMNL